MMVQQQQSETATNCWNGGVVVHYPTITRMLSVEELDSSLMQLSRHHQQRNEWTTTNHFEHTTTALPATTSQWSSSIANATKRQPSISLFDNRRSLVSSSPSSSSLCMIAHLLRDTLYARLLFIAICSLAIPSFIVMLNSIRSAIICKRGAKYTEMFDWGEVCRLEGCARWLCALFGRQHNWSRWWLHNEHRVSIVCIRRGSDACNIDRIHWSPCWLTYATVDGNLIMFLVDIFLENYYRIVSVRTNISW